MSDTTAYKVLTREEVERLRSDGTFHGSPADVADGFIHLSSATQLAGTIEKHFAGRTDIWVATVDLTKLADVRWEPSRGGALFPHLYGVLAMAAVDCIESVGQPCDDGR